MILSRKYQFIFIKTNKTAGTSVEIALSKFCGDDDIITPLSGPDETTRVEAAGRGHQHRIQGKFKFRPHMSIREVKEGVGAEVVRSYFKFCVVRNPWDRVVSFYFWRQGGRTRKVPFSEFIRSPTMEKLNERGRELYIDAGKPCMDYFIRYERLSDELNAVAQQIGLGALELPRAKSGIRPAKNYRDNYTQDDVEHIRRLFAAEIEQFGYEF